MHAPLTTCKFTNYLCTRHARRFKTLHPPAVMIAVSVKLWANVCKVARSIFTAAVLHDTHACSNHNPCRGAQNTALRGQRCSLYRLVSSQAVQRFYLLQATLSHTFCICLSGQIARTRLVYMPQCTEAPILHDTALHSIDSCCVILTHKAGGPCRLELRCCWTAASRCPADPLMSSSWGLTG